MFISDYAEVNMNNLSIRENLSISEKQVKEGKVLDAQESLERLKVKYGLCDENSEVKKG